MLREKPSINRLELGIARALQLLHEALTMSTRGGDLQEVCKLALLGLAVGQQAVQQYVLEEELSA